MNPKIAASAITLSIFLMSLFFIKGCNKNPLIGKWKSETVFPWNGKATDIIEFTQDSEYITGMKFKVKYEIEGKRVIVTDESGIGAVYEVIDKDTIQSKAFGFNTTLKRIN